MSKPNQHTPLPFWSDDFDMDLLKIYPNIIEALGATANVKLWTVGHETFGRLNHPATWNGFGAFFWFEKPNLPRDEHGWANIEGCVTNDKEIECTWLELLRDVWSHTYPWRFVNAPVDIFMPFPWRLFERLMWHVRHWREYDDINNTHGVGWAWLMNCNHRFAEAVERYNIGREPYPYFAVNSIPGVNGPSVCRIPLKEAATV